MAKRRTDTQTVRPPTLTSDVQMVGIEVPMMEPGQDGYQLQPILFDQIHVTSMTQQQRKSLRYILAGCREANVSMADGKPVYQRADAIRYLLERYGVANGLEVA